MKKFRTFIREFEDIGSGNDIWNPDHHKQKALDLNKPREYSRKISGHDYSKPAPDTEPHELRKHVTKKLSSAKDHAGYTVHHVTESRNHKALLLHHKDHGFIGVMTGEHNKSKRNNGLHVSESFIDRKHRGKGLGMALYEHAVKHYGSVVSDDMLSKHSQRVYAHFAKKGRVVTHDEYPDPDNMPGVKTHNQPVSISKRGKFSSPGIRDLSDTSLKLRITKKSSRK